MKLLQTSQLLAVHFGRDYTRQAFLAWRDSARTNQL